MPPARNRKRRNDEIASEDEDDNAGAQGETQQPNKRARKMTKAEKDAARERARLAMANPKAAAAAPAVAAPAPAPAPAPVASPPTGSPTGKMSKKELRERAKAAMMKKPAATSPAPAPKPAPAPAPAPVPAKPAASTTAASSRRRSTGTSNTASAAPRSTNVKTATRRSLGGQKVRRDEPQPDEMAMPPSSFPKQPNPQAVKRSTATGQETNEFMGGAARFGDNNTANPVLQQPPARPDVNSPPVMNMQFHTPQQQQQQPVEVKEEQDAIVIDDDDEEAEEQAEETLKERANKFLASNLFKYGIVPALVVFWWYYSTRGFVYNRKSGIFMVMGTTRIPFESQKQYFVADADDSKDLKAPSKICYHDSPEDVLELVDEENLSDAYVAPNDCATTLPCPHNAICFQGHLVDCQKPIWQLSDEGRNNKNDDSLESATPVCILSKSVNDTYNDIVQLLETWTISHMCLTNVDGVSPLAFYEQDEADPTALVVSQGDKHSAGIPLYTWSVLYKEGPENLDTIDYEVLKTVNQFHQKLTLPDGSGPPAVGLSKNQYRLVGSTKLPPPCKASRSVLMFLTKLGELCWGIILYLLQLCWYLARAAPVATGLLTFVIAVVAYFQRRKAAVRRRKQKVWEVCSTVLKHLQLAPSRSPGQGLRRGEVCVIHLRDEIAESLYGLDPDSAARKEFLHYIWPQVVVGIFRDNRVQKDKRPIQGNRRDTWTWIPGVEEQTQRD